MGRLVGKNIPVSEPPKAAIMDRAPFFKNKGDEWARNLSEQEISRYADRKGMFECAERIMTKAVIKDADGRQVLPYMMRDRTSYVLESQSGTAIGWVQPVGGSMVGRIYNANIDTYEQMANDPDRPQSLRDVKFMGCNPADFGLTQADLDAMTADGASHDRVGSLDEDMCTIYG